LGNCFHNDNHTEFMRLVEEAKTRLNLFAEAAGDLKKCLEEQFASS